MLLVFVLFTACPTEDAHAGPYGPALNDVAGVYIPAEPFDPAPNWDGVLVPPSTPIPAEEPRTTIAPPVSLDPVDALIATHESAAAARQVADALAASRIAQ